MGSLYYFKLAEDGKSIVHWAKWTGIFPKSVDNSEYAGQNKDIKKINVNFQTQLYEELDINLLIEFNNLNLMEASNRNYNTFRRDSGMEDNTDKMDGNKSYENLTPQNNLKSLIVVDENFSREFINKPLPNWNFYLLSGSDMNDLAISFSTDEYQRKSLIVRTKDGKKYYVLTPNVFYSVQGLNPLEESGVITKTYENAAKDGTNHRIFEQNEIRENMKKVITGDKKEVEKLNEKYKPEPKGE